MLPHIQTCTDILAQGSNYNSEVQNISFTDFLMDDEVNFDFSFDSSFTENSSNGGGLQQQWVPYKSTAASSSGEDLLTYNYGLSLSTMYSSSEGESGHSLIYYSPGHWNNINVSGVRLLQRCRYIQQPWYNPPYAAHSDILSVDTEANCRNIRLGNCEHICSQSYGLRWRWVTIWTNRWLDIN